MDEIKRTVVIRQAGTLKNLLPESEYMYITHLKIIGEIDKSDISTVLDSMCSSEVDIDPETDEHTIIYDEPPYLRVLDLGACRVVDTTTFRDFTYYPKLEEIIFPSNIESTPSGIDSFSDSPHLKRVVFPECIRVIGNSAFANNESLEYINFPQGLCELGDYAFAGCSKLRAVSIPSTVERIGSATFAGCDAIESFIVASDNPNYRTIDGVIYSQDGTVLIAYPSGRKDIHFEVPDGVVTIGDGAFEDAMFSSISLPKSLCRIGNSAFACCPSLRSVFIPDSVHEIGSYAFSYCRNLRMVRLPEGLKTLRHHLFDTTPKLKRLVMPQGNRIKSLVAFLGS